MKPPSDDELFAECVEQSVICEAGVLAAPSPSPDQTIQEVSEFVKPKITDDLFESEEDPEENSISPSTYMEENSISPTRFQDENDSMEVACKESEEVLHMTAVPASSPTKEFGKHSDFQTEEEKILEAKIDKLIEAEELAMRIEELERRNTSKCNMTNAIWHLLVFKVSCFYWIGIHFMGDLEVPTWSAVLMKSIFSMIFFFGYHFANCRSCETDPDEPMALRTFDYCSMFWMSLPGAALWISSDYLLFHFLHDIGITTYSLFDNSKFIVIAVLRFYMRTRTSIFQNILLFLTWIGCVLLMFSNFELNTNIFLTTSFILSLAEVTCEALAAVYFEWLFNKYQHMPFSEVGAICSFSCVLASLISLLAANNFENVLDWKTLLFLCSSACYEFVFYLGLYKTKNATLNQMAASNTMVGFVCGWHLVSNHITPTVPMIIEMVVIYICISCYFATELYDTKKSEKDSTNLTPQIDALLNLEEN